jgi:hypothetical protein
MVDGVSPSRVVQWPLIGVAALLAVLIFVTPGLLTSAGTPTAGSLPSTAVLVVDRLPATNQTRFYVEGLSPVRYAHIAIRLDFRPSWPAPASVRDLTWQTWTNASNTLFDNATTGANPVAVNVTAIYVDTAGTRVSYSGVYVFNATLTSLGVATLTPSLVGAAPTSVPLPAGPQPLPLAVGAAPPSPPGGHGP